MKKAIFTMSHKGGAGKSTFARSVLEHLRTFAPKTQVVAVDCQPKIGHLANYYGLKGADGAYCPDANLMKPFSGVQVIDIANAKNFIGLVDVLDLDPEILLVDLPGGAVESLKAAVGGIDNLKEAYFEAGYELNIAIGVNHLLSSAESIHDILSTWGDDGVRYIPVLNLGVAERDQFVFFDGERAAFAGRPADRLAQLGAKEFLLHSLEADTYALLEAARCPMREAIDADFSRGHQVRAQKWLARIDAEIFKLGLVDYAEEHEAAFQRTLKLNRG